MKKTVKKLAGILLAAAVAVAFMPAAGLLTGVDTAKAKSEYKAIVSTDKQSIELDITPPYADVKPLTAGPKTVMAHDVDGTTITVNDEWTDEDGNPVTEPLEKGKKYTYTATMISRTEHGDSAPDITKYSLSVKRGASGEDIVWPGYEYYDYVRLPSASLKTQITLDMPDSKRDSFDKAGRAYYGAMTFVLGKYANPLSVKAKSKTLSVKYKKLRKKAQVIKGSKVLSFKNKGKITVQRYTVKRISKKGTKSSKAKKYFVIGSKTGKLTVKKGLKKGTYKVTVRVKAAGDAEYKASAWKKVAFNVKVK